MRLSQNGEDKLKRLEGFRSKPYKDIVGVETVGYGFTTDVRPMSVIEANIRLRQELIKYEDTVLANCTLLPNQNEFDAMVLLAWNIGLAGFKKSSVLKAHNRGDKAAAARAFALWNRAGGKIVNGLVRRRAEEAALYLEPILPENAPTDEPEMPQQVDPERPMTASTINRASAVAGGTAAVAAATETVRVVNEFKDSVSSLGSWLLPALLVVTVAAAGYVVWERYKQRKNGVA